jgi:hypothetical protein
MRELLIIDLRLGFIEENIKHNCGRATFRQFADQVSMQRAIPVPEFCWLLELDGRVYVDADYHYMRRR